MLLTFFDMSARTHYLNARQTLRQAARLARRARSSTRTTRPTTDEISFGDNDFLAAQVAILIGADRLVLLTDTDGLYTADPRADPTRDARRARSTTSARWTRSRSATRRRRSGSGGMRSKVVAAEMATAAGIATVICNGLRPGRARPRAGRRAGRARASPPRERALLELQAVAAVRQAVARHACVVDAGAARALREGGTSLLPVGVVEVEGGFDAGDAVEVAARRPTSVGKGISNYSAAELRQVKGLKSAEVRELLPRATEEAVHRDYFVLA